MSVEGKSMDEYVRDGYRGKNEKRRIQKEEYKSKNAEVKIQK